MKLELLQTLEKPDTFLPIDTQPIIQQAQEYLTNQGIAHELRGVVRNKATHKVELLMPGLLFNDGGSDLQAKLILTNGNNGKTAFNISVGFLRLVCQNGLVIHSGIFQERIIHRNTPGIVKRVDELPFKIAAAIDFIKSGEALEPLTDLQSIEVATNEQAISIIGSLNVADDVKRMAIRTWIGDDNSVYTFSRRETDQPNNAYSLYNVVNEQLRKFHGEHTQVYTKANVRLLEDVSVLAEYVCAA